LNTTGTTTASYLVRVKRALDHLTPQVVAHFQAAIEDARAHGRSVWVVGNGGSATTSDHFATDLLRCADEQGRPVRAISLCSNVGVITATANDFGYEHVFSRQLEMFGSQGDVLVAISASGNSPSIIEAVNWAKAHGLRAVCLTGFDGGLAMSLADVSVHVGSAQGDYGVVEDAHLVACHMVAEGLRVGNTPIHDSEG
jgi:D-sedoheptulose 7-phosphate isomerase